MTDLTDDEIMKIWQECEHKYEIFGGRVIVFARNLLSRNVSPPVQGNREPILSPQEADLLRLSLNRMDQTSYKYSPSHKPIIAAAKKLLSISAAPKPASLDDGGGDA